MPGKKTTLIELELMGVNTKICHHCKEPLRLREKQKNDVPGYYLFSNGPQNIQHLFHRICKPKYIEKLRK